MTECKQTSGTSAVLALIHKLEKCNVLNKRNIRKMMLSVKLPITRLENHLIVKLLFNDQTVDKKRLI